jgi:hypothetical protein
MGKRLVAVAGLLCLALAATGCAKSTTGAGSGGPSASTLATPTPSVSSPSAGPSPSTGEPSGSPAQLVLSGQVQSGVEPGCLILTDAGRSWELLGGDPAVVKAGARVRVTGHIAVGVMSHCMQGTPFQVSSAQPL